MTVKKLVIPTTFTDLTLPKLDIDPVTAETGAVFLFDSAHPEAPGFVTGDLTSGFTLPNLVYARWHALYGSSSEANSKLTLTKGAAATSPHAVVERSTKGGIHMGFCQEAVNTNRTAKLEAGSDIRAYVAANPTHSFFWSVWGRITRKAVSASWSAGIPPTSQFPSAALLANFYTRPAAFAAGGAAQIPTDGRRVGWRADGAVGASALGTNLTDTGPYLQNIGVATIAAGSISSVQIMQAGDLTSSPTVGVGAYPSALFYRSYLEDLTVSGRTYAQVDALDWAEYQKQVKTPGGRYYGDTFTDPATLT